MKSNFLLFMPSLMMSDNAKVIAYTAEDSDITYHSAQTNVPAAEYVIRKLYEKGEKLSRIIMICSNEVMHNSHVQVGFDGPVTSYEYLTQSVSRWMLQNGYSEQEIENIFLPIPLEDIRPGNKKEMNSVISLLEKNILADVSEETSLYLDYTGGIRTASMLLLFTARLFESEGIKVKQVLYSNISYASGTGVIEDCMDTYSVFEWLDARTHAEHGDTATAEKLASQEGEEIAAKQFRKTQKQLDRNKDGMFSSTPEKGLTANLGEKGQLLEVRVAMKAAEKRKTATSKAHILDTFIIEKEYKKATVFVYENTPRALQENGIIVWHGNEKEALDQFVAYETYYMSYLRFVHKFLRMKGMEDDLWAAFEQFMEENEQLKPWNSSGKDWMTYSLADYQELEDMAPKATLGVLEDLIRKLETVDSEDDRLRAMQEYRIDSHRLLVSYYSNGFPFGNRPGNKRSFTFCGDQNYIDMYLDALEDSVSALADMPLWERRKKVSAMKRYEICNYMNTNNGAQKRVFRYSDDLMEAFPPVEIADLFVIRQDIPKGRFGAMMQLYDHIRLCRNAWVHSAISEEGVRYTDQCLKEYRAWVP